MENPSAQGVAPSPGVAGVVAYSVPKHGAPIDLKLDANEGEAPAEDILRRIIELGPDVMRRYPDASALQALLAARFGADPARLIVTAGADDALDRLCRAVLAPGRRLLLTNPSFEMLPRYARIAGAEVDEVPWWSGPFPTAAFIAAIQPSTTLVAMVTPNNPTGTVAKLADLEALSAAAPNAIVLLDHAYVEFADEDFTKRALAMPNVVIARTLSKAWGLAGLRVGYAIGPAPVIGWMRASGGPYAVSRPSIALAAARIEADRGSERRFVAQVRADRALIHATLDELGVPHTASEANFAFVTDPRALWIRDALAGLGIAIRAYPGHPELGQSLRITCPGNAEQAARLEQGIRAAIRPETIVVAFAPSDDWRDASPIPAVRFPTPGDHITTTGPAWLVSDDPSKLSAARAAGMVPIGYDPEGNKAKELTASGAARVLSRASDLKEILP